MTAPVGIAFVGMGWWGKKMLSVLEAAPGDIRVVRAVEPNLDTVQALCAEKGIALSANYADALERPSGGGGSTGNAARLARRADRSRRRRRESMSSAKSRWPSPKPGAEKAVRPLPGSGAGARHGARAAMGSANRGSARQGRRRQNSAGFTRSRPISATTNFLRLTATTGA